MVRCSDAGKGPRVADGRRTKTPRLVRPPEAGKPLADWVFDGVLKSLSSSRIRMEELRGAAERGSEANADKIVAAWEFRDFNLARQRKSKARP